MGTAEHFISRVEVSNYLLIYFLHVKHSEGVDEDLEGMPFDKIEDAKWSAAETLRNEVADGLRSARR